VRRLLAASALLAALVVPGLPGARAASVIQLTGTLRLTGSATGVVHVRVPRATSIDIGNKDQQNGNDVKISGRGRFVGAVIEQHMNKDKTFNSRDRSIYALRYSLCGTPTCTAPSYYSAISIEPSHSFSDRPALPAGDYDIYLVADGQPTTVTLSFKGLGGSRSITPTRSKRAVQWSPPVAAEQIVAGHGTRETSGERGIVVSGPSAVLIASWQQSNAMQRHMTMCLQQNSAESSATSPAGDCAAGLTDGRTVLAADETGETACLGLCTVGLEDSGFAFGFMFFTEVDALPGARLLGESQATGQFGYESANALVLPW
jgi:hypothetical protein